MRMLGTGPAGAAFCGFEKTLLSRVTWRNLLCECNRGFVLDWLHRFGLVAISRVAVLVFLALVLVFALLALGVRYRGKGGHLKVASPGSILVVIRLIAAHDWRDGLLTRCLWYF
jgi:hypothetical protein